jgi:hypothetical protein
MVSFVAPNRRTLLRACLHLEELESRSLLSALHGMPVLETVNSTNWSGYAAETNLNSPQSNAVSMASGSWTVPTVSGKANAYSSVWVGIDGYSSPSVEQLGTEQDTTRSGATRYYAWWEMYPNPSFLISGMTISPGDSMSASVSYSSGAFTLQMQDSTTGQKFSTTQSATAQRSSAEWIVEAPSSVSGVLPLANFGTAKFTGANATINGHTGAIDNGAWQNTSINMVNQAGTTIDQTSTLTDSGGASSFSVTFPGSGGGGHGHGHHPTHDAGIFVPLNDLQAAAALGAKPYSWSASLAASTSENPIVSTRALDALFAQVHEHGATSQLDIYQGTSQSDVAEEDLGLDVSASNDIDQIF